LPSHAQFSGEILDSAYNDVQRGNMQKQRGKMGTGQCDGWKDITKNHLQGFMVCVDGVSWLTNIHNMSAEQRTGAKLLGLMEREEFIEKELEIDLIGWTSDAGPDSKKACKDLVKKFPHLLETDCIA
ncbi:uncharacterized protein EI90DRAFT_2836282, partial [Cantharellus anzutake]|uniref:uncharacterized protein n=1 Tax=Cantharellus anzutake TaxID=1750568 RepID=UPI00190377B5